MGTFFKGWRRKMGVLTLVIACVFVAGWVRSCSVIDVVDFAVGDGTCAIVSSSQKFRLVFVVREGLTLLPVKLTNGSVELWSIGSVFSRPAYNLRSSIGQLVPSECMYVPYWSIVIPLTLLSAYLLLSKPRKAKPPSVPAV